MHEITQDSTGCLEGRNSEKSKVAVLTKLNNKLQSQNKTHEVTSHIFQKMVICDIVIFIFSHFHIDFKRIKSKSIICLEK